MKIVEIQALVLGTGAAGYQAACQLKKGGRQVAIVTEGVNMGTSRNTGSDKQTYYKLGLGGDSTDSVRLLAEDLFAGGSVDGDNALCEAALSARCFLHLCELGVPFPTNRYGEFVGYKTDHDPHARATSAGPLTSKFMTQALETEAKNLNIPVYDNIYAVQVLQDETGVCGLLGVEKTTGAWIAFHCADLVLATGGPAGVYADSVYPACHTGASSLAFRAGAAFQNMTEWQYGLASTQPRWNVSGTYMQVLPRFVSVDQEGTEREFLRDYFADSSEALSMVFLKGYQWPFDSAKALTGSSVIDLLVYRETTMLGRQVYLDYRENPFGAEPDYEKLQPEAYTYLKNAGCCFGKPVDRLLHMNRPAYELYLNKGVDLQTQMLPIALCAQHCNGGISVDLWWQTNVPGLFACGECAGTHGISRPGGSALNAGQAGALRAAQYICQRGRNLSNAESFAAVAERAAAENTVKAAGDQVLPLLENCRRRMSNLGGPIRKKEQLQDALMQTKADISRLPMVAGSQPYSVYQYRDALITQQVLLESMLDFCDTVGATRGSALYYHPQGQKQEALEETFRFAGSPKAAADRIQTGIWNGSGCEFTWRNVRPLPDNEDFFENIWRTYRENKNVY